MALFGGQSGGLTANQGFRLDGAVRSVKEFGAVGDGVTDDGAALLDAFESEEYFYIPEGDFLIDPLVVSNCSPKFTMMPNSRLICPTSAAKFIEFNNCDTIMGDVYGNGDGKAQAFFKFETGTVKHFGNLYIEDVGDAANDPTNWTAGLWMNGVTAWELGKVEFYDFRNVSSFAYGDSAGRTAVRGIVMVNCGYGHGRHYRFDATGSYGKELDLFHVNVNNVGGKWDYVELYYNGNTRRAGKIQSGKWDIVTHTSKASDFAADSGSTEAGLHCLNCWDVTAVAEGGFLSIGGYMDATGFAAGLTESAGGASSLHTKPGLHIKGAQLNVIRTFPEGAVAQNQPMLCVSTHSGGTIGSKITHCVIEGGGQGARMAASKDIVSFNLFLDPKNQGFQLGADAGTACFNQQAVGNILETKTPTNLSNSRMHLLFNSQNCLVALNTFRENGNTTYTATRFIQCSNANATGTFFGNIYSNATNALTTDKGSAVVREFYTNHRLGPRVKASTAVAASPKVLTADEAGIVWTNEGATAKAYFTLPAAALSAEMGLSYRFSVQDTDGLRIVAGSGDTIRMGGTVSGAAGYTESTTRGDYVELVTINATEWVAMPFVGTWTTV